MQDVSDSHSRCLSLRRPGRRGGARWQTGWSIRLFERYYVPRKLAQTWVNGEQVLPLLDGLDKVAPEHRAACVEAINTFRSRARTGPLGCVQSRVRLLYAAGALEVFRSGHYSTALSVAGQHLPEAGGAGTGRGPDGLRRRTKRYGSCWRRR